MSKQKFPFPTPEPEEIKAQLAGDTNIKRQEHVWFQQGSRWKCCLCGAVTLTIPPNTPTPKEWMPHTYERLTDLDRSICPLVLQSVTPLRFK